MDALKAEIAVKRKALQDPVLAARPTKYIRRGELERLKEERERDEKEAKEREERERKEEEEERRRQSAATKVSISSLSANKAQPGLMRGWRAGFFLSCIYSFSLSR